MPECQGAVMGVGHFLGVATKTLGNQGEPSQMSVPKGCGEGIAEPRFHFFPEVQMKKRKKEVNQRFSKY